MLKTHALAAAALCTAALFSTPAAFAAEVNVTYADLDLSSAEGQSKLQTRIEQAAVKACDTDRIATGTILSGSRSGSCVKQARKSAKRQVALLVEQAGYDVQIGG